MRLSRPLDAERRASRNIGLLTSAAGLQASAPEKMVNQLKDRKKTPGHQ